MLFNVLVLTASVACTLVSAGDHRLLNDSSTPKTCNSPIYCDGPLLKTVQMARLFEDSKTFVDMPTSKPVDQVLAAFEAIGGENADKESIGRFVHDNFQRAGAELVQVQSSVQQPLAWLDKVDDLKYRGWIERLHGAWANLTFEFDTSELCDGCASSTLPVKRPFVVPGGRFREFYYWDSFFVIKGLLLSDLDHLAKNMIENFLDFVDIVGFMPNGARIYYLNRSQPPFLTEMVKIYYEKTKDKDFMRRALPILDKEYNFWMKNTTVTIRDQKTGKNYQLNRYNVENHFPRPESYFEDYQTAHNGTNLTETQIIDLFSNLATGAETGWDYSSRWTRIKELPHDHERHSYDVLRSLDTRNIVPIELNALLWSMENTLAEWHLEFNSAHGRATKKSKWYARQASKRLDAIDKLHWNQENYTFYDYNLTSHRQSIEFTPASMYPFWLGAIPERVKAPSTLRHVFDVIRDALEQYPGILTTSFFDSSMQWDWPNGWPPLQYITLQAMIAVNDLLAPEDTKLLDLAHTLAERNAATAFCSWYKTGGTIPGILAKAPNTTDNGHMFEKFDVRFLGGAGSGGEYTVQVGFGWTNGITLWIFDTFRNLTAPDCNSAYSYNV
ncbi:trehalase [Radiomyces spectabilis]|uniref:trehalase n=1 Tax=Radiomyces spectabilis TaxID=64574 RepID=UPI00221E4D5D|nr:trehalase [Radiomyces spectabilis]KAI8377911.1 trehalase [Radiomyces spectabilis]